MFGLTRFERFIKKVKVLSRDDWVIIYETEYPEMNNPAFRDRVLEYFHDHPTIILPKFCSWDEWTFHAERRPTVIDPGCCRLCNHPYLRDNRCERTGCGAIQKPVLGAIDLW